MIKRIQFASLFMLFMCFSLHNCAMSYARGNVIGPQGLILTPSATLPIDRQVCLGFSQINSPYVFINGNDVSKNYLFYSSLMYLPRLEITLLITSAPGMPGNDGSHTYKDAAVFAQYFATSEKRIVPAVAVGIYDFYSYSFYNALFIVASKNLESISKIPVRVHLGYGVDWLNKHYGDTGSDLNAPVPHHLVGIFGGLDMELFQMFNFMVEYDTQKINSGLRVILFDRIEFFAALLSMKTFSGGINFKFKI